MMLTFLWQCILITIILPTSKSEITNNVTIGNSILPSMTMSMRDLPLLLTAIENSIPFGYAHFNDGEIEAMICKEGQETDWGWQKCSSKLSTVMLNALIHTAPNFYTGITCACEFWGRPFLLSTNFLNITHSLPVFHNLPNNKNDTITCPAVPIKLKFLDVKQKDRLTVATIFINGNRDYAKKEIIRILKNASVKQGRGVHVVHGRGHHNSLPFHVKSVQKVAHKNAFEENYETFRTNKFLENAKYLRGDIVLIMAGPLGRILSSEWTRLRPDITFLEMGSFWDSELWGRKYGLDTRYACMHQTDFSSKDT